MVKAILKSVWLGLLLLGVTAHAENPSDDPTPLTAPALNTFLQTLFSPVRESEKDWLQRLDLTFTKLDLEKSLLAFQGGVGVANSAWSREPSRLDFAADLTVTPDGYTADLNHAKITLQAHLATETLALARYAGEHGACSAAPAEETEIDRDYRLAHCAFGERLRKVATVRELGVAFLDSVEDLTAQLSDYERGLLSAWAVVPEMKGNAFHVSAKASGTKTMTGTVDTLIDERGASLKVDLVVDIDDSTNTKIATIAWTYLGGLLDADSRQLATLQKSLGDYVHSLKPKSEVRP